MLQECIQGDNALGCFLKIGTPERKEAFGKCFLHTCQASTFRATLFGLMDCQVGMQVYVNQTLAAVCPQIQDISGDLYDTCEKVRTESLPTMCKGPMGLVCNFGIGPLVNTLFVALLPTGIKDECGQVTPAPTEESDCPSAQWLVSKIPIMFNVIFELMIECEGLIRDVLDSECSEIMCYVQLFPTLKPKVDQCFGVLCRNVAFNELWQRIFTCQEPVVDYLAKLAYPTCKGIVEKYPFLPLPCSSVNGFVENIQETYCSLSLLQPVCAAPVNGILGLANSFLGLECEANEVETKSPTASSSSTISVWAFVVTTMILLLSN